MIAKSIITIIICSTIIFSQADPSPKYNNRQDTNKIGLLVLKQVISKYGQTDQIYNSYIMEKIYGITKIISRNDSSINVWNGKLNTVELSKIQSIRIKNSNNSKKALMFSLCGLGLGALTGFVIGNSKEEKGFLANLEKLENSIDGALYGGLIGLVLGGITGLVIDSLVNDFVLVHISNFQNDKKISVIEKYLKKH